jgi:hypothetical protein
MGGGFHRGRQDEAEVHTAIVAASTYVGAGRLWWGYSAITHGPSNAYAHTKTYCNSRCSTYERIRSHFTAQ